MATRKKTAPAEESFLPEMTATEWDIEDFLDEWAPQTAVVEIYRKRDDGSMPHLRRVDMDILREDLYGYLRQHFGNGKYVLQFKGPERRILKRLTMEVEGAQASAPGSAPVAGNLDHVAFMREQMQLQQTILTSLIASMRGPDLGTLLQGLAAMKPATPDMGAMLAAVVGMFTSLKSSAGESGDIKKALELISAAKDIGGGSGDGGETWPGLIKEVGVEVLKNLKPNAPTNGNGTPVVRSVVQHAVIPESVPTLETRNAPVEETQDMLIQKWLAAEIALLKQKALAGKDVNFWIDYIFENQEEPGCQAVFMALERGATFQNLLEFDPEIGKNPALTFWFKTLYEKLSAGINEDVDSAGAGGDAPNPGGNAKPSPQ
jgi:hypothetical protein